MTVTFNFSRKEVEERIPYALICQTACGSKWDTARRRRMAREFFESKEINRLSGLINQSKKWYLRTGIPMEGVSMTSDTYDLWQKFGQFCMML